MLSAKPYAKWRRICERIALSAAIVVFLAAGASTLFNALAIQHNRAIYPPQGRLYPFDGYKMHLYCTGEGSPTIVLDAGLGNDSLNLGQRATHAIENDTSLLLRSRRIWLK
jgi:hypothetical protein